MKILKLRAWDGSSMHYQQNINSNELKTFISKYGNRILMQSLNILDKNGKTIFEGDIVKAKSCDVIHPQDFHSKHFEEYLYSTIYWDKYQCAFEVDFSTSCFYNSGAELEVIGNIYETPELINKY